MFNHQSNVDINNRIVCYDIKELGKQQMCIRDRDKADEKKAQRTVPAQAKHKQQDMEL